MPRSNASSQRTQDPAVGGAQARLDALETAVEAAGLGLGSLPNGVEVEPMPNAAGCTNHGCKRDNNLVKVSGVRDRPLVVCIGHAEELLKSIQNHQ